MKELDKNALLEEAKRRYPIGTKFKIVHCPENIRKVTSHEKHDNTFVKASDGLHINFISDLIEGEKSSCISASVYFNGKWAEIVEEPKVETKFEKGKWYYYEHGENGKDKYYLKYDKHNSSNFYYIEYIRLMKNAKAIRQVSNVPFKFMYNIKEVPLSEIQQYLPNGHPDKIKQEVKEDVKSIEEWSVGSYAVALINAVNYYSTKKGDIYLIRKNHIADNLTNGNIDLTFILPRDPEEFKWFPTLQEAQKFSDELLGKSKTELRIEDLVEGEFYYCETNISKELKQWVYKYLTSTINPTSCTYAARINGSYYDKNSSIVCAIDHVKNLRLATSSEKKWLKTCIKQDKFIPKEDLDKYDDEGNLMGSKEYPEYYECIEGNCVEFTKGRIYKIVNSKNLEDVCNFVDNQGKKDGWAEDNYNHFKPSTKEAYDAQFKKDEEFKVGDKVICIKNEGFKIDGFNYSECLKIGKLYTVNSKVHKYCDTEELSINIKEEDFKHPISNFRKALSHEIPAENSVKQYPYTPEESFKLDFEVKWKEPIYIGGVDPISAFSCGIFEQMKKQSPQSRKTPDLIDKSKVEVKIKRTKVKQIKL